MKNSIRKIASLCLAMMMVLSIMAVPAFAEERAVHIHEYDTTTKCTYTYHDNDTHLTLSTSTHTCSGCGDIYESFSESYDSHIARGTGTLKHTMIGSTIVYYYEYTCKVCNHSFVSEEF